MHTRTRCLRARCWSTPRARRELIQHDRARAAMVRQPRAQEEAHLDLGLASVGCVNMNDRARRLIGALDHAPVPKQRPHQVGDQLWFAEADSHRHSFEYRAPMRRACQPKVRKAAGERLDRPGPRTTRSRDPVRSRSGRDKGCGSEALQDGYRVGLSPLARKFSKGGQLVRPFLLRTRYAR